MKIFSDDNSRMFQNAPECSIVTIPLALSFQFVQILEICTNCLVGLFFFLTSTSWFVFASLSGSGPVATRFHPPFYFFLLFLDWSCAQHGLASQTWPCRPCLVTGLFAVFVYSAWFYTDVCQSTGTALWAVTVPAGKSLSRPEGFGTGNQIKFQSPVVALLIEQEVALLLPGGRLRKYCLLA